MSFKDRRQPAVKPNINEHIRTPQLQVITHEGENVGVIARNQALRMADDAGLDLVVINDAGPEGVPIAKIMDHGKVLYEKKKKQSEGKKQHTIQVKEIKLRPKIGEHDFQTKIKQAVSFLKSGKRVKVSLFFRGRENIDVPSRQSSREAYVLPSFTDGE